MAPPIRFVLAVPFLTVALLLSIPSYLCMYIAGVIEGEN